MIYSADAWHSDKWDALDYGQGMDFTRPFFEQLRRLQERVPRLALHALHNENSPYVNLSGYNKNCYLIFAAEYDEDCLYGAQVIRSRNCVDTLNCYESEGCYEVVDCEKSYRLLFSRDCSGCSDSAFLFDCKGCSDCLLSSNLRNKKFCVFNKELPKKEYEKRKKEFIERLQAGEVEVLRKEFEEFAQKQPHRDRFIINSENADGNYLQNSRNLRHCFDLSYAEDCAYVYTGFKVKDLMDVCHTTEAELGYEGMSLGYGAYGAVFTHGSWSSRNTLYCDIVQSCSDCFGCVCLQHKKYCILNKQYSKEEYEELVPRIIAHMQKTPLRPPEADSAEYEWGAFFPITISPFAYNETLAQECYPLSKKEAQKRGWDWCEEEDVPQVEKTIPAAQLPPSIKDIPNDILRWAITCESTCRPFKIIKQELDFYRTMGLPVPRLHPDERHRRRMAQRNPRKLWSRKCGKCGKGIETTYRPARPEIVYCEECYLKAVY